MLNGFAKRTRFKRKLLSILANNQTTRYSQEQSELSEEEVDRRAWAAANRILPVPVASRRGRGKSK